MNIKKSYLKLENLIASNYKKLKHEIIKPHELYDINNLSQKPNDKNYVGKKRKLAICVLYGRHSFVYK
ncbi:hypothetical protein HN415_09775, partial [Candidatus Woesearchaeota archaeon]|nr:hypothetical protein [Candidatus Woesearchaeota archaeon]